MKLPRRQFLHLAAGAAALPAVSHFARAQAYPTRPVRIIVPFAAAGAFDIMARLIGQWLSERVGQQFVVENRPGAGGNIATEAVVRAPPDGYTLLLVGPPHAINATLYQKLNFNFIRDIAPVASIIRGGYVIVVNPSVPAKTVPQFIAYAKANPGKISMGSPGVGTTPHVAGELFKMMAGVDMVHVPYRGSAPLLIDLLSGQVQVAFDVLTTSLPHIRSGALRALAMAAKTRFDQLPDVPTIDDAVPGYEASAWAGVGVPSGTAGEIIERLNREINAGLVNPTIKARLAEVATTPKIFTPAEFGDHVAAEIEKWAKVVKFSGARTSPSKFSPSRSGCCRAPGCIARSEGASLSDAAGAHHHRLCARWRSRDRRAPDRSIAVGAARPAIHHREPTGRRHQYRHRGGGTGTPGRIYAPLCHYGEPSNTPGLASYALWQ